MHYITPDDAVSNVDFLSGLGEAGFDQVLDALGKAVGLDGLVAYYASYIALSHCTGTMLHADAENTQGRGFNLIWPVLQVEDSPEELILGLDPPDRTVMKYKYEPEAAIALGDDGMHGTAPCDYRDSGGLRMVMSVYVGDVTEENLEHISWPETDDPPYPRFPVRDDYIWDNRGRDWNKDDPTRKLPTREYFEQMLTGQVVDDGSGYYY